MSLTALRRRWVVRLAAVVAMAFATLFIAPTAAHAAAWHQYGVYPWNQAQQCWYAGYYSPFDFYQCVQDGGMFGNWYLLVYY
jgi:hypothetical protein